MANLPNPVLSLFTSEYEAPWHAVSLWLVWVICLVVFLPNLWHPTLSVHCVGGRVRNREGLDTVQTLFSNS